MKRPVHNVVPGIRHAQLFDCVIQQRIVHVAIATVNIVDIGSILDRIPSAVVAPAVYMDGKRVPTIALPLSYGGNSVPTRKAMVPSSVISG